MFLEKLMCSNCSHHSRQCVLIVIIMQFVLLLQVGLGLDYRGCSA